MPTPVGLKHVELKECAGKLFALPRCRSLAGAQTHDGVLHPHGLTRLHGDVANDPVSFVEKRNDRHAFVHRRDGPGLAGASSARKLDAVALILFLALAACNEQQRQQRAGSGVAFHAQSGVQAW